MRLRTCLHIGAVCTLVAAMAAGSPALAGPITIDNFTTSNGNGLASSGLSLSSGQTTVSESPLDGVLGGTRRTTLVFVSGVNQPSVNLKQIGDKLMYTSKNGENLSDGSFTLRYNGTDGLSADFSSATGLTLSVDWQNNPNPAADFVVTLTSGTSTFVSATQSFPGNTNGTTIVFPFATFTGGLSASDLGSISSVSLFVDPTFGTNLALGNFMTLGTTTTTTSQLVVTGPVGTPTPEPASLVAFGVVAGLGVFGFHRKLVGPRLT